MNQPTNWCLSGVVAAMVLLGVGSVGAAPIELSVAEFATRIAGLATVVENFEGFAPGHQPNPLIIANGTATLPAIPFVATHENGGICPNATQCLWDNGEIRFARTFSALPAGTSFWGTDFKDFSNSDPFAVTVVGASGTLTVEASGRHFWGFQDASGISSISFLNLGVDGGFGNYGFDNVTTARNVTEPATIALLSLGLAGLGLSKRKRT